MSRDRSSRTEEAVVEDARDESLWHRLTRPFWWEPVHEVRRRWFRFFILAPFGAILGVAFGVYGSGPLAVSPLFLSLTGAVGAVVLLYLIAHLESWIRLHVGVQAGWRSGLLRVSADLLGGAILGHFLGRALDAHVLAGLTGGGALMAAYSHLATSLLLDDSVGGLVRLFTGQSAGKRKPDYSYETSLAARGLIDEALTAYEEATEEYPADPVPLLKAARMLREHGRHEEALERYRRCLEVKGLEARQALNAVLQIREICLGELDDDEPVGEAFDVLVERFPDAPAPPWLRAEVAET